MPWKLKKPLCRAPSAPPINLAQKNHSSQNLAISNREIFRNYVPDIADSSKFYIFIRKISQTKKNNNEINNCFKIAFKQNELNNLMFFVCICCNKRCLVSDGLRLISYQYLGTLPRSRSGSDPLYLDVSVDKSEKVVHPRIRHLSPGNTRRLSRSHGNLLDVGDTFR